MAEGIVDTTQVLLTAYDSALSHQIHQEQRRWRVEDLEWRSEEKGFLEADLAFLQQEREWRLQDLEQRHLDNARVLWQKFVEKNRRDVEEKAEQLRTISGLAAILAGFAAMALLNFQYDFKDKAGVVLPLYSFTMAAVVGLEVNSLVVSALLLASILRTGKTYVSEEEEAEFMHACRIFSATYKPGDRPPAPPRSFAAHWARRCEHQWRLAYNMFVWGIPFLFVHIAVSGYIKFKNSLPAAIIMMCIMAASMAVFLMVQNTWAAHLLASQDDQSVARMPIPSRGLPFDWHQVPSTRSPFTRPIDAAGQAAAQLHDSQGLGASNGHDTVPSSSAVDRPDRVDAGTSRGEIGASRLGEDWDWMSGPVRRRAAGSGDGGFEELVQALLLAWGDWLLAGKQYFSRLLGVQG